MKTVLLIEDDQLDVTLIKRAFGRLALAPVLKVAQNGVDALAILNGNSPDGTRVLPDIILLDMNMPEMSGLEFLGIIKNYYSLKAIKIFVMITSAEEYDVVAAQQLGVEGYILKPLDFDAAKKDPFSASVIQLKKELTGTSRKMIFPLLAGTGLFQGFKGSPLSQIQLYFGTKVVVTAVAALGILGIAVKYGHNRDPAQKTTSPLSAGTHSDILPAIEEPAPAQPLQKIKKRTPLPAAEQKNPADPTDIQVVETAPPAPVYPRAHKIVVRKIEEDTTDFEPNGNTESEP